jgi:hypothetical protein
MFTAPSNASNPPWTENGMMAILLVQLGSTQTVMWVLWGVVEEMSQEVDDEEELRECDEAEDLWEEEGRWV